MKRIICIFCFLFLFSISLYSQTIKLTNDALKELVTISVIDLRHHLQLSKFRIDPTIDTNIYAIFSDGKRDYYAFVCLPFESNTSELEIDYNDKDFTNQGNCKLFFFKTDKQSQKKWTRRFKKRLKKGFGGYDIFYKFENDNLIVTARLCSFKYKRDKNKYPNNKFKSFFSFERLIFVGVSDWGVYTYNYSQEVKRWILIDKFYGGI